MSWAADLARGYAPELDVVAVAATAPAANLPILLSHEWNSVIGSLIGSEVLANLARHLPGPELLDITNSFSGQISKMAAACVEAELIKLDLGSHLGGKPLIKTNPLASPQWAAAFAANTPPPPPLPVLLIQGTNDPIVLPGATVTCEDFLRRRFGQTTGSSSATSAMSKQGQPVHLMYSPRSHQRFAEVCSKQHLQNH